MLNTRVLMLNTQVLMLNTRVWMLNTRVLMLNKHVLTLNTRVLILNTRVLMLNTRVRMLNARDEFDLEFSGSSKPELWKIRAESSRAGAFQFLSWNGAENMYVNKQQILVPNQNCNQIS